MTLEFENLPLVEVVARFILDEQKNLPLSVTFLVDLRDRLGNEFPEISDLPTYEAAAGQTPRINFLSAVHVVGARYANPETGIAVHVQQNQLIVRWSRGSNLAGEASEYPRFEAGMKPAMRCVTAAIEELLGEGSASPVIVNMAYSNFLATERPLTFGNVARYVTFFDSPVVKEDDELHSYEVSFRRNKEIDLKVSVQATITDNPEGSGFVLTTGAGTFCFPDGELDGFGHLDRVHEALIALFDEHLTTVAREEWKGQ